MIIAFDGNVYTGKTTLIKELNEKMNCCVVPEYCEFINSDQLSDSESAVSRQRKYLLIEQKRSRLVNKDKTMLVDRSFISLAAHVWTLYKLGIADIRADFAHDLAKQAEKGTIIIPDALIHLCAPHSELKKRFEIGEKGPAAKNTHPSLMNCAYLQRIEEFNTHITTCFKPSITINTGGNKADVIKAVEQFIASGEKSCDKQYELIKSVCATLGF